MAAASAPEPDELVELNVGGSVFLTTRATLCAGAEPSSMLSALLDSGLPSSRDSCGRLFIDRDGTRFRHVLNYLRSGALHHDGDRVALQELREEAMYFGLEGLARKAGLEISRLELEEDLGAMASSGSGSDASPTGLSPNTITALHSKNVSTQSKTEDVRRRLGYENGDDGFRLDAEF